jgi:hypothetical protein
MAEDNDVKMLLKVDGNEIDIGPFVQRIISSAIVGMVAALKGVDEPKRIEIAIDVG